MRQDRVLQESAEKSLGGLAPTPGLAVKTSTGVAQSQPEAGGYALFSSLARLDRGKHRRPQQIGQLAAGD